MRKWIIAGSVVVIIAGVVGTRILGNRNADLEIQTATVEERPLVMTVETSGTVEPLSTVEVGCEVTGKIIEMTVDHESPVTKGQVLCRIDPELPRAENEQSKADHLKAQAALEEAKFIRDEQVVNLPVRTKMALGQKQEAEAELVDAEYNWHRVDELHKNKDATDTEWTAMQARWMRAKGALTVADATHQQALNNEKVLIDRANQAIAQAEAALQLAKARLDFTTTRVDRCVIRSPIDGVVLRRFMDVGQTVTAAFQTPVLFLLAPNLTTMKVSAKVGESDISNVEVDQKAHFTVQAKQERSFQGKILQKRSQPDIINNVVTFTVLFEVENPDRVLLPGLSVNVVIECVTKPKVPQIANAVLRFKPPLSLEERQVAITSASERRPPKPTQDANGQPVTYCSEAFAWQYDSATNQWKAVPLWVGITDNVNTEIVSGAKPGDQFVRKYTDKSSSSFGLKDAIKLASPENRSL